MTFVHRGGHASAIVVYKSSNRRFSSLVKPTGLQSKILFSCTRRKMYEIPPSVNVCLLEFGNTKSLIHFPAVIEERERSGDLKTRRSTARYCDKEREPVTKSLNKCCGDSTVEEKKWIQAFKRKRTYSVAEEDEVRCPKSPKRETTHVFTQTSREEFSQTNEGLQTPQASATIFTAGKETRLNTTRLFKQELEKNEGLTKKDESPVLKNKSKLEEMNKTWRFGNFQRGGFKGAIPKRCNPWGSESYSELISKAIMSCSTREATLQQIYEWIVQNIPYFADKGDYPSTQGWKNAVRHTLSIRKRFTRIIDISSPHSSLWTFTNTANNTNSILRRTVLPKRPEKY